MKTLWLLILLLLSCFTVKAATPTIFTGGVNVPTIGIFTNAFIGPTNVLNLAGGGDQYYRTVTSCSFTGVTGKATSGIAQYVLLSVYNASATNITITIPASVMTRDGLRSYTITNATMGFLSVRYANYFTNAVFSQSL